MRALLRRYLGLFLLSGIIIVLDQWTKNLLRSRMTLGESWPGDYWLIGLFKIVRTENSGAAFSMGSAFGPVFLVLAIAAALGMIYFYATLPVGEPVLNLGVGLLLAGTVGNLIDRLNFGQVTDFIMIRYFAIVNVADISITLGVAALILWYGFIKDRKNKPAAQIN